MAQETITEYEEGITVAAFPKNSREEIRVRLTTYRGIDLLDVRSFYEQGGVWRPGKGLAIRRELTAELRRAIAAAEDSVNEAAPLSGSD